jgi:hypothetical protein
VKCSAIDVATARARKNFSHVYFNFRNTKFGVIHPGFMEAENILRISAEILTFYASDFSYLVTEGPNNDFPTKVTK